MATSEHPEWEAEFTAAARRGIRVRLRYSFFKSYRPVLDDAEYRSVDTMEDYRVWCERNPGLDSGAPAIPAVATLPTATPVLRSVATRTPIHQRAPEHSLKEKRCRVFENVRA